MDRGFLFSFVVPVFNCAEYLGECIESVLTQSIGFERGIQLVLVNDGSTDGSDIICKSYRDSFPESILYIEQENAGANAARMRGLGAAEGRYVNFLDADDKWSEDACAEALRMLEAHPDLPLCAARHRFFGAREAKHPLDYKFRCDSIIDIFRCYDYPQLSLSNCFVRRELLQPQYFDPQVKIGEDCLAVNLLLLDNPRYGVLSKPIYWYRKREGGGSAQDGSVSNAGYYEVTPRRMHLRLIERSKELYGRTIPYLQFMLMYDLQWRMKPHSIGFLDRKQLERYRSTLKQVIDEVDLAMIGRQRNMFRDSKLACMAFKMGMGIEEARKHLRLVNGGVFIEGQDGSLNWCWGSEFETRLQIDFVERRGTTVRIEGFLHTLFPEDRVGVRAEFDGGCYEAALFERRDKPIESAMLDDRAYSLGFLLEVPCSEFMLMVSIDGNVADSRIVWGRFSKMHSGKWAYRDLGDNWYLTVAAKRKNSIRIRKENSTWLARRETLLQKSLATRKDLRKALAIRRYALMGGHLRKKKVWLLFDRADMAGDNAEALFAYLQEHPVPGVDTFFVLTRDSPDRKRLEGIGRVVDYRSYEHLRLMAVADKVISSCADTFYFDLLDKNSGFFREVCHYDFVFLQHGVTKDDQSSWLKRYSKDIAVFVTASQREFDSIVSTPAYSYTDRQVALTGFPRHDVLLDANAKLPDEKKILIAPTWRKGLVADLDVQTGKWRKDLGFKQTRYYTFWQSLLNDERLAEAAGRMGYTMNFLVHPAFRQNADAFSSGTARILHEYNYTREFATSSILVTDYSSVAFDFALLEKPLMYAQFDEDTFYEGHLYDRGYFDYRRDGFGPVAGNYEDTVGTLIELMGEEAMDDCYKARVRDFFYTPKSGSRSQEVVEAILNLP